MVCHRGRHIRCGGSGVALASPSDEAPRGLTALRRKLTAYQANGSRRPFGWGAPVSGAGDRSGGDLGGLRGREQPPPPYGSTGSGRGVGVLRRALTAKPIASSSTRTLPWISTSVGTRGPACLSRLHSCALVTETFATGCQLVEVAPKRSVGAFEAKTHLAALLDAVSAGEQITITRHGGPVARLVPDVSPNCAGCSADEASHPTKAEALMPIRSAAASRWGP